jgi:hypothetical protein
MCQQQVNFYKCGKHRTNQEPFRGGVCKPMTTAYGNGNCEHAKPDTPPKTSVWEDYNYTTPTKCPKCDDHDKEKKKDLNPEAGGSSEGQSVGA